MTRATFGDDLALLNACLNASCAILLVCGRVAIARKKPLVHRAFMLSAFATSCIFLTSYLTRMALTGTHYDHHTGWLHPAYLIVLASHVVLAMTVVPMVLVALRFAFRGAFDRHVKVTRVLFPVWLYVSITGVIVYVVLYRVPV